MRLDKNTILDAIRRLTEETGTAPGFLRFSRATEVRKADWYPHFGCVGEMRSWKPVVRRISFKRKLTTQF